MSIKRICDCCGEDIGWTWWSYKLVAPISIHNLEICKECFCRIQDEIIKEKENEKRGTK